MQPTEWTCPHCNSLQTVTEERYSWDYITILNLKSTHGRIIGGFESIVCANPKCKKLTLLGRLHSPSPNFPSTPGKQLEAWKLIPESSAKPQPEYIPTGIKQDYYEACKIRDLSPKALATLARRCIQGMIRDFCKISKGTLFDEIKALKALLKREKNPGG